MNITKDKIKKWIKKYIRMFAYIVFHIEIGPRETVHKEIQDNMNKEIEKLK